MTDTLKITKTEIERLAKLARLDIPKEDAEIYAQQLDRIVDYVSLLNEVELKDVDPLYHVLDQNISGREDIIGKSLITSELLKNAPDTKDNLFKVPPVIVGKKQSK